MILCKTFCGKIPKFHLRESVKVGICEISFIATSKPPFWLPIYYTKWEANDLSHFLICLGISYSISNEYYKMWSSFGSWFTTLFAWEGDSAVKPTPSKSIVNYFQLALTKLNKKVQIGTRSEFGWNKNHHQTIQQFYEFSSSPNMY